MATQQFFAPYDSSTITNFYTWANGMSNAIAASGWTRITTGQDPGVVVWANVQSALSTYTTGTGQIPSQAPRPTIVNSGAGVTTIGAWSSSSVVYSGISASTATGTASIVTYNGLTWICISGHTSSGSNTPGTSGGSTFWLPYIYEIFASNDTLTSSLPIYFKVVYCSFSGAAFSPAFNLGVGTNYLGNSLLGGNLFNLSSSSPEIWTGISQTTVTSNVEWDVCSNGQGGVGNISWMAARGAQGANSQHNQVQFFMIDRAKTNTGQDNGAYFCVAMNAGTTGYFQTIFAPSTGGRFPTTPTTCVPSIYWGSQSSGAYNGTTPVYPIFPVVGYLANPLLGAVVMNFNDTVEGGLIEVVMYGGAHTFLGTQATSAGSLTATSSYYCMLMRWE